MANTKISALSVLGKSTFTGDDYILVARGTSANFKVSASSLLPTLADAGSGSYLLSIASQNAFTQKALASGNSLLTIANISTSFSSIGVI